MIKYECLGIRSINFKTKVKSKRLSKIRNKIHQRINCFKKKILKKRNKFYKILDNDIDIITQEDIINIPKSDLLLLHVNNNNIMGISASNLLKWMIQFDFDKIPKNPYTNKKLSKLERTMCYIHAQKYYDTIKKCNSYLINKLSEEELKELDDNLLKYLKIEYYRKYPEKMLCNYDNIINELFIFLIRTFEDIPNGMNIIWNMDSLLNIENSEIGNTLSDEKIITIKSIVYQINYAIDKTIELKEKIISGFFN